MAKKASKAAASNVLFQHKAEPPRDYVAETPVYDDMPPLNCTYEVASDTPQEMQAALAAADQEWAAIADMIGDKRLDKTAYFHLACLPDGQMEEFRNRVCAMSDDKYDQFLDRMYAATETVNFAWIPHWFGAIMPAGERKVEFLDRIAVPRLMGEKEEHQFPIHFVDLLCEHDRSAVEKYLPLLLDPNMGATPRLQAAFCCYHLTEEERLQLVICKGHTSETLAHINQAVTCPSTLSAVQLLNMDIEE